MPVVFAAGALILAAAPAQYLGRQQDDLLYLVAARSLSSGLGMRLLTCPGAPRMTMINPVFPLLLAPLVHLFGDRFGVCQAFSALLLACVPLAVWAWLRRRCGDVVAAFCAAAFAASPLVLSQSGTVMSEPLFTLLAVAALACLDRPTIGARRCGTAGALLLALTQTRLAGLPVAAAAAARPLREGRWRRAALVAGPALAGLAVWAAWSHAASGGTLQKLDELSRSYAGSSWRRLPLVAADNARFYLSALGGCALPARWAGTRASLAAGAAWAAASSWGGLRLLRKRPLDPAVLALGGTAAMHLVWPWQYDRYLIMPLPLLLWTAAEGLGRAAVPALALLLAGQLIFQAPAWLRGTSWRRPELPQTYAWLRDHAKPTEVLASALYLRDGFYAGTPSAPLADASDPAGLSRALKAEGARWVLEQRGLDLGLTLAPSSAIEGRLSRISAQLGDRRYFEPAYRNDREQSLVYRVE